MAANGSKSEPTISIRLVWPFARMAAGRPALAVSLARVGIHAAQFADPDTRIPYRDAIRLLSDAILDSGDAAVGLRAGLQVESGDFDVVESAARSTENLRAALECMGRYLRLLSEGGEMALCEQGETATWTYRPVAGVSLPPAVADFVLAAAATFVRRNVSVWTPPREVLVPHPRPPYAGEYESIFAAPVRFGAPGLGFVFARSRLDAPMLRSNPRVATAFEIQARRELEDLQQGDGTAGRVRRAVAAALGASDVSMQKTARKLAMSVATLRRRLEEEGTTYTEIVDELRKTLAEQYVRERASAISEVAFLLGFSNATAFHRAFKRWTGVAPMEYRARVRPA